MTTRAVLRLLWNATHCTHGESARHGESATLRDHSLTVSGNQAAKGDP